MGKLIVILFIIVKLIAYVIRKNNLFIELREEIQQKKSEISNYRENRSRYLKDALNITTLANKNEVQSIMTIKSSDEQLNNLRALAQRYPEISSNQNYTELLKKIAKCDHEITACKSLLNNDIKSYNKEIKTFPAVLVAKMFKYRHESFLDEENMEANKSVDIEEIEFEKYQLQKSNVRI